MIAQISQDKLRPAFREKLEDYIAQCEADEEFARDNHLVGIGTAECYADTSKRSFNLMVEKRRAQGVDCQGLFSDLVSNLEECTDLEALLLLMSSFDPAERISAEQALEFFTECCVEENNS